MPFAALDILDEDPLNLFADELNEKKKKKKKSRREHKDIFSTLGLDEEGEIENEKMNGKSFLKLDLSQLPKSVSFNDEIQVKEISRSENSCPRLEEPSVADAGYNQSSSEIDVHRRNFDQTKAAPRERPASRIAENPLNQLIDELYQKEVNYHEQHSSEELANWDENLTGKDESRPDNHLLCGIESYKNLKSTEPISPTDLMRPHAVKLIEGASAMTTNEETIDRADCKSKPEVSEKPMQQTKDAAQVQPNIPLTEVSDQVSGRYPTKEYSTHIEGQNAEQHPSCKLVTENTALTRTSSLSLPSSILKSHDKTNKESGVDNRPQERLPGGTSIGNGSRKKSATKLSPRRPSSCQLGRYLESPRDDATDAASFRMMAYREWYLRSQKSITEMQRSLSEQEAKASARKMEASEKAQENEKMFLAWKSRKRSYFREQLRKKKEEEALRQKQAEEANEKKLSCEKAFEVWKARKDAVLVKQVREKLQQQKASKENQLKEEELKRAEADKAFQAWKTKKENELREFLHHRRQEQTQLEKTKEAELKQKSEKAAEAYYQWEIRKVALLGAIITGHGYNQTTSLESIRSTPNSARSLERAPWRPPSGRPHMTRGLPS